MDGEHVLIFTLAPVVSLRHHGHKWHHWFDLCYLYCYWKPAYGKILAGHHNVVQIGVFHVFQVFPQIENVASLNFKF